MIVALVIQATAVMITALAMTRGNVLDIFVAGLVLSAVLFGVSFATTVLSLIPIFGAMIQFVFGIVTASIQAVFMFLLYAGLRDREG